ncbi:MAG: LutB/LldF family L-lactate oxidation iron-sulfur protein, partial [Acidimicrobiia bacterium]|nr:LutB/LldF family L-lactate oxidation iron-sulfur protein [Acidimicrobiia bacterium]
RRNIGNATHTIRDKRAAVIGELSDWAELRQAGAAIKDNTLADLGDLLEQFEANVTDRGGIVHWAADADEANRIVIDIATANGATDVVKVKSMATQEIRLNEALAEAGVAAWETDLAELIVQLGNDMPSHILVPAIHRNRSEIREIFRQEMGRVGVPAPDGLSDKPADLAEAARLHLRQRFLSADMAISGANFGVAETGTVMVVESEGNGRMCLTLPRVLVTVMGIEKLIATWRDLEVYLQLLPRSSTGERMNPYTTMWTGVTPGDGPEEFHLVLLDNGRSTILADPDGRAALRCIRCSACLNVCPVYERTGGHAYGSIYPGPIGAVLSPQLTGVVANPTLPFASSLCGACYEVCPVAIDIPTMLVRLRAQVAANPEVANLTERSVMRSSAWLMAKPNRWRQALRGIRVGRLVSRGRPLRSLPPPLNAWTATRDLPPPPAQSFRAWWAERTSADTAMPGRKSAKMADRIRGKITGRRGRP